MTRFSGPRMSLSFGILHLLIAEAGDHEMMLRNSFRLQRRGSAAASAAFSSASFFLLLLPPPCLPPCAGRIDCGDATVRHGRAQDDCVRGGRKIFGNEVGAGRQGRPAEDEPFEIAAELLLGVTGGRTKGLHKRLTDPAVVVEAGNVARCGQAQQPHAVGKTR